MMLVDAAHRGQGIGQRLLERALEFLDRSSVSCAKLDATPEGRGLYEKHGFVDEHVVERWALARPAGARTNAADERAGRRRSRRSAIEDVLRLDRELFGADRGDLLRSLAAEAPDLAIVFTSGDQRDGLRLRPTRHARRPSRTLDGAGPANRRPAC